MTTNTVPRATVEQALEALEKGAPVSAAITLRAALAAPIPHGCHVDLEEGMEPDGCVLDEGRPGNCIYARRLHREGKDKTACEYWQPIQVRK